MTVHVDTIDNLTATPTKSRTWLIGIDAELTPLDDLEERIRYGEEWIESDYVMEVKQ